MPCFCNGFSLTVLSMRPNLRTIVNSKKTHLQINSEKYHVAGNFQKH